jgi:hypothetical protein
LVLPIVNGVGKFAVLPFRGAFVELIKKVKLTSLHGPHFFHAPHAAITMSQKMQIATPETA